MVDPGGTILLRESGGYPPLLATLPDAPERLYFRGDPGLLAGPAVAVVGSRKPTGLGKEMAERLGAGLAGVGIVVVSGCAVGIDAAAHRGALGVGGKTVAVLGGGLDVAAPPSNRRLAEQIAREGCLLTEHEAGTPPFASHFPKRNRIIAGLVRVVVVVEAAKKSGAGITARLAAEAGREVMAVPHHPLIETSEGSNGLIVDGARPVLGVEDVLKVLFGLSPLEGELPWEESLAARRIAPNPATGLKIEILEALSEASETAEALAIRVRAPLPDILAALTELEILGQVRRAAGGRYAAVKAGRAVPTGDAVP